MTLILAHGETDVTTPPPGRPSRIATLTSSELSARIDTSGTCSGTADDAWHPEDDPTTEEGRAEYEAIARALCRDCPVKAECLILALRTEARSGVESHGIWGGTAPWERKRMIRRTKRRAARRAAAVDSAGVSA